MVLWRAKLHKWSMVVIVVVGSFALTGCYDREELEHQAFITTLGLDEAPGGLVDCTLRIALPVNNAGGGGGGGTKSPLAGTTPVTFRAHGIYEAMLLANSSIERSLTFSHLTLIIFGSKLAEHGVLQQIQPLIRFREFRPTVLFAVSKTTARDIVTKDEPMLEKSAGRIADSIAAVGQRTGLFPVTHIHDLSRAIENPHEDLAAPLYAVNETVAADKKGDTGVEQQGVSYTTGDIHRAGGNPVEWGGAAIFHMDKVTGYLTAKEALDLNIMRGVVQTAKMRFADPSHPADTIGLAIHQERKPNVQVVLGKPMKVFVNIPLDADLTNTDSGVDYSETANRVKLENQLNRVYGNELTSVLKKTIQEYHADCLPISATARRSFGTHQAFAAYPWQPQLEKATLTVQTKIHIRRYGVQMQPVSRHN